MCVCVLFHAFFQWFTHKKIHNIRVNALPPHIIPFYFITFFTQSHIHTIIFYILFLSLFISLSLLALFLNKHAYNICKKSGKSLAHLKLADSYSHTNGVGWFTLLSLLRMRAQTNRMRMMIKWVKEREREIYKQAV